MITGRLKNHLPEVSGSLVFDNLDIPKINESPEI